MCKCGEKAVRDGFFPPKSALTLQKHLTCGLVRGYNRNTP